MVCKMIKKGLIGAALGAGALYLAFGTAAPSYVRTTFHKARAGAKASVPFEFEIDRARQEVANLIPAIHQNIEVLAKAEVDCEHLTREIALAEATVDREGRELAALAEHLRTGDVQLTGGVSYSPGEIKAELARRLDCYKQDKANLSEKRETLKIRQKNVAAAREQLSKMQAAKRELTAKVDGIEARLNQIKAVRASDEFNFDDSAVGRARQTVSELSTRLDEMARVDELKSKYAEKAVTVTVEPGRDVLKEVDRELGTPTKPGDKSL